jgi:hypothetical protein
VRTTAWARGGAEHRALAGELRAAVGALRAGRVGLDVRRAVGLVAAEDVVGRHGHDVLGDPRDVPGRVGVDPRRRRLVGLGAVHVRVRRAVDDPRAGQPAGDRGGVGQVEVGQVGRLDLVPARAGDRDDPVPGIRGAGHDEPHRIPISELSPP